MSCCALFKRVWSTLLQKVVPVGHRVKNIGNYMQEEKEVVCVYSGLSRRILNTQSTYTTLPGLNPCLGFEVISGWSLTSSEDCIASTCSFYSAWRNISSSVLIFVLWTFLCCNWDLMCVVVYGCFYPLIVQWTILRALHSPLIRLSDKWHLCHAESCRRLTNICCLYFGTCSVCFVNKSV